MAYKTGVGTRYNISFGLYTTVPMKAQPPTASWALTKPWRVDDTGMYTAIQGIAVVFSFFLERHCSILFCPSLFFCVETTTTTAALQPLQFNDTTAGLTCSHKNRPRVGVGGRWATFSFWGEAENLFAAQASSRE